MTPDLSEFVSELRSRGITLEAEGELLRASPWSALTQEERDRLQNEKAELVELLTPAPVTEPETPSAAPVAEVTIPKAKATSSKVGLPPWLRGDSSKPVIVRRTHTGLRIEHDFTE